jgi:hypothetical protein
MLPAIENPLAGAVTRYSFSRPPFSGFFRFYTILLGYLEIRFRVNPPAGVLILAIPVAIPVAKSEPPHEEKLWRSGSWW